ncbi:aminopeptidase P family protein [Devosia sp. ZB163]|uniref:aminopeptidase P family protein n=1 Tax=Devosia sp. ZB163 TaxID=3025938 RepID=UPI0023607404|nr:aminopeptidase P family protein [Devosia sp. ZB163]MDC9826020.1 aminopeptidase P family protein [Devosia sp. ZB163]
MNDNAFAPAVYQTFDIRTDPRTVAPRVKALRTAMKEAGVDAFLVPRTDAHRGESVPASEARLSYVTSFTGSAGLAIIGSRKAALFVDGRYTLQAPAETDTTVIEVLEAAQGGMSPRIAEFVPKGGKVGFDPWLHTPSEIADLEKKLAGKATLVPVANLVDTTWTDRPAPPVAPIEFLGHNRAGRNAPDKLAEIRATMAEDDADALVLTVPESINWLFNLRGRDVPHVPVVLCYALVPKSGMPTLFFNKDKITPELRQGLEGLAKVADVATMVASLRKLGAGDKRVMVDPGTVPVAVANAIKGVSEARLIEKRDPVLLPKARKNDAELGGMREAHRLDGAAMAKFLHWFDTEAPKGKLDEITIATALESFRREDSSLVDISFDTISGAGPNGAVIHYRVDARTNRGLKPGELMLVDSGAQYLSGTTDITRTLFTGKATAEQKDRFTRVLRGMMAVSMVRFPRGTTGAQIDVLARQFLWADGINYNHGTGHGVGAFLSVHEGPIGISPRYPTPFEPGMITSNEPGYYKEGAYGIRIENLLNVIESEVGEGKFLEFETLTLTPIDLRLIDVRQLSEPEREWLNAYHKRVFKEIGPLVKGEVKAWLKDATREI